MNTTFLVARREFTERLRSRTFLVSNGAILALLVLAVVLPQLLGDDDPTRLGVVGDEATAVGAAADGQQDAFGVDLVLVELEDAAEAEQAVIDGDVDAVLVDATTVVVDDGLGSRFESLLTNAANAVRIDEALSAVGLASEERAALLASRPLTVEALDTGDGGGGIDLLGPSVMIVFAAVFVLYGLLALFGQWVAQGIVEEKQSRVVEVLLASVRPSQLLAGKILGLGALGLAQILLMAAVAIAGLLVTDILEVPAAAWTALVLVIPWFALGFGLYATLFAMAGAVVSRVEDMQSAVMPVIIVLVLALFGAQFALSDPSGTVATVAGLVPLTAPMVQPVLFAAGASSWVESLAAIVLAIGAIAVMVPISARIYRGGVLRTRGRVRLREAWASARR